MTGGGRGLWSQQDISVAAETAITAGWDGAKILLGATYLIGPIGVKKESIPFFSLLKAPCVTEAHGGKNCNKKLRLLAPPPSPLHPRLALY